MRTETISLPSLGFQAEADDEVCEVPARKPPWRKVLRGVRGATGARVRELRRPTDSQRQILLGVRLSREPGHPGNATTLRRPGQVHAKASCREDPPFEGSPRGRAQAGYGPLR